MDAHSSFVVRKSGSIFHLSRSLATPTRRRAPAPLAIAAGRGVDVRGIVSSRYGWLVRRASSLVQRFLPMAMILCGFCSLGANARTANFVVTAATPDIAQQIAQSAEQYRKQLALEWLGREMPTWAEPCPITVQVGQHLGAGGATSFMFERGEVYGWRMTIQGSMERVLDSVLPHEVTHTIFATHFRRPLPRWADEGACTTVEHASERAKQQTMLVDFLRTQRGIAFSQLFAMKEYPQDVMPLYSQGYSLARYLISQGGKQKFLNFLSDGMRDENWSRAVQKTYGYTDLAVLQNTWLQWVKQGSPALDRGPSTGDVLAAADARSRPEPNLIYHGPSGPPNFTPASNPSENTLAGLGPAPVTDAADGRAAGTRPASRDEGWHAPGTSPSAASAGQPGADQLAVNEVADFGPADGDASHQSTRPQSAQQARQIIIEWTKGQPSGTPQVPAAPAAIGPPGVGPTLVPTATVPAATAAPTAALPATAPQVAGTQRMAGGTSVYGGTVIR